jgi:predicted CoA-binding protein
MADSADNSDTSSSVTNSSGDHSNLSPADAITRILKSSKTIAVVGLSNKRMRPSYGVAEYLKSVGYQIIPVNPNETEVLGEKSYLRLQDVPTPVDIVDIFRRSEFVPEIADAAIEMGARCIWMQEGVIHAEAADRARRAGIFVVMNSCILKEHMRRARELQQRSRLL